MALRWTLALSALSLGGLAGAWWLATDPAPRPPVAVAASPPAAPRPAGTLPASPPAPPRPDASPVPASPDEGGPADAPLAQRSAAPAPREETVDERLERIALEEQARERFDAALERTGITAAEIEDGVKRLFETMRVEPVLLPGGRMEGMVLRELPPDHPFRRAGFADGDRLVRLDGWPLEDAAEIPEVMIRLKRSFTACVLQADGSERCREVTTEAPTG